jgi:hypothetical protein
MNQEFPLTSGIVNLLRRATLSFMALVVVLVALSVAALGQTTGTISGAVKDPTGAVIPGAKVTLINQASKATRTAVSNGAGFFSFNAVQPTIYSVEVKLKGFKTGRVTGIELHPGDNLTVDKLVMSIGEVDQQVTVTAETAGVSLSSPEHSALITAEDIKRLSTVGRDATELLSILPGFTLNASGGNIQNQGPDNTTTQFGGNVSSYGANGAAPESGQVNVVSDGASIIDPGSMGGTIATINMDQVQEVKVQTANFGADEAKGPVVISAVGKSGGSNYHGSVYTYLRNSAFNSNDWLSNDQNTAAPGEPFKPLERSPAKYIYPGGSIGGPVLIPGTHFNRRKHLYFWAGFEYYGQTANSLGPTGGPLFAFIPTPAMLKGDLSPTSIASAFNVPVDGPQGLLAGCTSGTQQSAAYVNLQGDCYSPGSNGAAIDQTGAQIVGGQLKTINPATTAFSNLYPAINRTPVGGNGYASDGFNYVKNVLATNNGLQFHSRIDQNFSDSFKLYITYNYETINGELPTNNIYYNPPGTIPFPTPLYDNAYSDYLTVGLTKVINNSTTNELTVSGVFYNSPQQFGDRSKADVTGTPWAGYAGGALKNGVNQFPQLTGGYEPVSIPVFSFAYVPPGNRGEFLRKDALSVTDNLTKVYHTHTIKAGVYAEQTRNNQINLGSAANGSLDFSVYGGCEPNQTAPKSTPGGSVVVPAISSTQNVLANFLIGCADGYSQDSSDPNINMYFNSLEFYGTDEWKVTPKLTLTYGIRLSHLPPWTDAHGIGSAVWNPDVYRPIPQHVLVANTTSDNLTWPGISWHAVDKSIPVAGVPTRTLFYSPRAGLAYDLYGNGKTVFRGGFGIYRSRDSYNNVSKAASTAVGVENHRIVGNKVQGCTLDQLFNAAPINMTPTGSQVLTCGYYTGAPAFNSGAIPLPGSGGIGSITAANPKDDRQPLTYNYNFTLDQQLPRGTSLEIAYVGNQSTDLFTVGPLQNQNVIPFGAYFSPDPIVGQAQSGTTFGNVQSSIVNDYRPYPNYQQVNVPNHTNWANYNSLQVSVNKQRGSLIYGVNYTWSKSLAVRGSYDTGQAADPVNAQHDYGITSYSRPQAINFTYSYQEGKKFRGNRALGAVLNNWEISGKTSFQSGPDLSIILGTNYSFGGGGNYYVNNMPQQANLDAPTWLGTPDYVLQPTVTCDPRAKLHSQVLAGSTRVSRQFVNGACFGLPTEGTEGAWNLPNVHGPSFSNSDLSIYKDVQIKEHQSLQFRMAGFNFLNHPLTTFTNNNTQALQAKFADPTCTVAQGNCYTTRSEAIAGLQLNNAGFGFTPFKTGVRIVEFGVKLDF